MKWITREHIKVDRVACPWLIRRFIDPQAQFLFVDESELLETAAREHAIPFDAPRLSEVKLNHRGMRCSFEAFVQDLPPSGAWTRTTRADRACRRYQRPGASCSRRDRPAGHGAGLRGLGLARSRTIGAAIPGLRRTLRIRASRAMSVA